MYRVARREWPEESLEFIWFHDAMRRGIAIAVCLAGTWPLVVVTSADERKAPPDGIAEARSHWAYRPVAPPTPPVVRGASRTAVDRFILAALESKGFGLNPPADRATLIRRVSFDLTGLPPS